MRSARVHDSTEAPEAEARPEARRMRYVGVVTERSKMDWPSEMKETLNRKKRVGEILLRTISHR